MLLVGAGDTVPNRIQPRGQDRPRTVPGAAHPELVHPPHSQTTPPDPSPGPCTRPREMAGCRQNRRFQRFGAVGTDRWLLSSLDQSCTLPSPPRHPSCTKFLHKFTNSVSVSAVPRLPPQNRMLHHRQRKRETRYFKGSVLVVKLGSQ